MCPWKHFEMLATWKCSKMAVKWLLNAAVQLTAVSIQLTAARTDVHFTYCCLILFNSIFFSAFKSIISFLSFRFNQNYCTILLLITKVTQSAKFIFRIWEKKNFKPTSENRSYIKMVKIMVKKVYGTDKVWYGVKRVICWGENYIILIICIG